MNAEELEKLHNLRKKGIITEEEFNSQKNKLLSKKEQTIFLGLALFLGYLGIHNFYVGQTISGIFKLILFALSSVLYSALLDSASLELALPIVSFLFMGVWLWVVIEMCITDKTASGVNLIPAHISCKTAVGSIVGIYFILISVIYMIDLQYIKSLVPFSS